MGAAVVGVPWDERRKVYGPCKSSYYGSGMDRTLTWCSWYGIGRLSKRTKFPLAARVSTFTHGKLFPINGSWSVYGGGTATHMRSGIASEGRAWSICSW